MRAALAGTLGWGLRGQAARGEEPLYLSSRPGRDTYFRYDADGNLADVVKADLAVRVVRMPSSPASCYGAADGDFLSIRFAAAYETGGSASPADDASLDLLARPKQGGGRWQVFDTSDKRGGVFRVPLGSNQVVAGLDIGLHGMCEGERRVLYVPAALAYAGRGNQAFGVPPNAALRYDVELEGLVQMGRPPPRGARRRPQPGSRSVPGRLLE